VESIWRYVKAKVAELRIKAAATEVKAEKLARDYGIVAARDLGEARASRSFC